MASACSGFIFTGAFFNSFLLFFLFLILFMPAANDIHRKAAAARKKQAHKKAAVKESPRQESFIPLHAESRQVFNAIYPHRPRFLPWIMLPLVLATIAWTLWLISRNQFSWLFPYAIGFSAFPVVVTVFTFFRKRIDYLGYKNWRAGLGFPVNGWDQLGQTKESLHWRYWDQLLTVSVNLKEGSPPELEKLAEDILYLFTIEANKCFYAADPVQPMTAGDLRREWTMPGTLSAEGSANCTVMGELYLCITNHLRDLQQNNPVIETVELRFSGQVLEVQPLQVSD